MTSTYISHWFRTQIHHLCKLCILSIIVTYTSMLQFEAAQVFQYDAVSDNGQRATRGECLKLHGGLRGKLNRSTTNRWSDTLPTVIAKLNAIKTNRG